MGEMYVFLASILFALSTVFAHYLTKGVEPLLIVFYSFIISFVFFNIVGFKKASLINLIRGNLFWVIFINLSTAVDWLLIFLALKYISAALINCFVFGVAPVVTLVLAVKSYPSRSLLVNDTITCCLISVFLCILSVIYYWNNKDIISSESIKWGILLSFISGLAAGSTIYSCKMLQNQGFSTIMVMRLRFMAIIFMTFILLNVYKVNLSISYAASGKIFILAFIFIIIPTFLMQKGIELVMPVGAAIITSLIPVLTYLFQFFESEFIFDWKEMVIITILSFIVFGATLIKQKAEL